MQLIANCYDNLSKLYTQLEEGEKVQFYQKKLDDISELLDRESENVNQNLADHYHNLALESAKQDEMEKAIAYTRKALDVLIGLGDDENWDAVTYY